MTITGESYFHKKAGNSCWLLLSAPMFWLSGLPDPPPEDSLKVPCEGGLLAPDVRIRGIGVSFVGADEGKSKGLVCFGSFFPSAMKLPTTTCREDRQTGSIKFFLM